MEYYDQQIMRSCFVQHEKDDMTLMLDEVSEINPLPSRSIILYLSYSATLKDLQEVLLIYLNVYLESIKLKLVKHTSSR